MAIDGTIEELSDLDADFDELVAMAEELHEHHMPLGLPALKTDFAESWRKFIAPGPERLVLIARFGDDAIGYMAARLNHSNSTDEVVGFIDDAYVRPMARRFGVGEAMLERAESWCRERGVTTVRLNVLAANEIGMSFWRKSGYAPFSYTMAKTLDGVS
jgi:GNAT superfamily N-acetyltransferase